MTPSTLRRIADRQRCIDRILFAAFPKQRAFALDRSRRKFLFCPRRAGKSEGIAISQLYTAYRYENAPCLYLGLTRGTAKAVMWSKLKEIVRRIGLDDPKRTAVPLTSRCFHETDLILTIPQTGSTIRLAGMDADKNQRAKVLGGKYKEVDVDEAASFRVDLRALIRDFLEPATQDLYGSLGLGGTPDPDEARGYFYDVTTDREPGWTRHAWNTLDNPYMREQWQAKLDDILATDPLYMETPEYKCMYLAQWPDDPSGWVYAFNRERNVVDSVPTIRQRVVAIDLGFRDDCAIVESGWTEREDRSLYALSAWKKPGILLDELADNIRRVAAADGKPWKGTPVRYKIDGANLQAVEEMRRRYQIPLQATDKHDKAVHVRIMNTEMIRGRYKVLRGACTPLVAEWSGADENGNEVKGASPLVWSKRDLESRPPRLVEDSRCANHCADAALYGFRGAWPYLGKADDVAIVPGTEAEAMAIMAARRARVEREMREDA